MPSNSAEPAPRPRVDATHAQGLMVGEHNQQFNLPAITVIIEQVGGVIDGFTSQLRRDNEKMQARLGRLQQQLRQEQALCKDLRDQAAALKSAVREGAQLQRQLADRISTAEADALRHVAQLQEEITAAREAITEIEQSREQLREEHDKLANIEYALEGRALVQFERAQHAEQQNAQLTAELAQLRAVLALYQNPAG